MKLILRRISTMRDCTSRGRDTLKTYDLALPLGQLPEKIQRELVLSVIKRSDMDMDVELTIDLDDDQEQLYAFFDTE